MRNTGSMALAVFVAAGAAHAQVEGTATWLWDVTTQDGDIIVEPGETASVTLSVDMEPDVNLPNGPVLAFGGAEWDTLGMPGADNGHIVGWDFFHNLEGTFGDTTTTDGVSLFGSIAAQFGFQLVNDDPIDIMVFEWAPDALGQYDVSYITATDALFVWQTDGGDVFDVEWTDILEANIAFSVVPAPGALGMAAAFGGLYARRRRRPRACCS